MITLEEYMMFSGENLEPVVYKNTKSDSILLALTLHINNATMVSLSLYVVSPRTSGTLGVVT